MKNNRLHTPDGVRDYLPKDFLIKKDIERKIESIFYRFGYLPVSSPMFEFMEVFENIGGVMPERMYKFLDRDGSILALRPDITPSIARIAATSFSSADMPLRLCYFENTFRYNENYQGKLKEFTQAGIELIGINSTDANAEVIAVAVDSLLAAGLGSFVIYVGQVQFLNGILEESGLDGETCAKLQQNVLDREFTALERAVKNADIPKNVKELLEQLHLLPSDISVIKKAAAFTKNKKALAALSEIESIYEVLCHYGMERYIRIDLSMAGHLDYYTGLIFRGYASGTGASILDGGRYDGLLSKFGAACPAVGFAIKCNRLISVIDVSEINIQTSNTLVSFSPEGRQVALEVSSELKQEGVSVENSLIGYDVNENIEYAKKKKYGGMLYFADKDNVTVFDFINSAVNNVNIKQLKERLKNENANICAGKRQACRAYNEKA